MSNNGNKPLQFVLLEDDDLTADHIEEGLLDTFGANTIVRILRFESEFWDAFDDHCAAQPDAYIFDVRVRWTTLGPKFSPQPNDKRDFTIAGWRCYQAVKAKNPNLHCVLFTVLDDADLRVRIGDHFIGVAHVTKSQGLDELVAELRKILVGQ
ncbi:MAG: hypothetical protein ACKV2Q_08580 [Planctomycetaceae bacterium]